MSIFRNSLLISTSLLSIVHGALAMNDLCEEDNAKGNGPPPQILSSFPKEKKDKAKKTSSPVQSGEETKSNMPAIVTMRIQHIGLDRIVEGIIFHGLNLNANQKEGFLQNHSIYPHLEGGIQQFIHNAIFGVLPEGYPNSEEERKLTNKDQTASFMKKASFYNVMGDGNCLLYVLGKRRKALIEDILEKGRGDNQNALTLRNIFRVPIDLEKGGDFDKDKSVSEEELKEFFDPFCTSKIYLPPEFAFAYGQSMGKKVYIWKINSKEKTFQYYMDGGANTTQFLHIGFVNGYHYQILIDEADPNVELQTALARAKEDRAHQQDARILGGYEPNEEQLFLTEKEENDIITSLRASDQSDRKPQQRLNHQLHIRNTPKLESITEYENELNIFEPLSHKSNTSFCKEHTNQTTKETKDDREESSEDHPKNNIKFDDHGHLVSLILNENTSPINRNRRERHLRDFKITWEEIPKFAVITGQNGSGKSYLLEQIRNNLNKSEFRKIKFTYLGADEVESFNSSSILGDTFTQLYKKNPEKIKLSIFNHIKGNNLDEDSTIESIVKYLLLNNPGLREKDESEIRSIIADQCERPSLISSQNEINLSIRTIMESAAEAYKKAKESLSASLKESPGISKLCAFWQKQNQKSTSDDLIAFLQDKEQVNALIDRLVDETMQIPDTLTQLNRLLPGDFPYKLLSHYGDIVGYPRSLEILDKDQINAQKIVELGHMSSGEQVVIKVASLAYYNQGLKANKEEIGAVVSKPNIILLDEPDRHLDPKLCQMFFDSVYNILFKQEGIQVIMTTHRIDTVALAPNNSIYIMERGKLKCKPKKALERMGANLILMSKRGALSELSSGMLTAVKDLKYVMVEAADDVIFYSIVYKKFLAASFLKPCKTELIFTPAAVKPVNLEILGDLSQSIGEIKTLNKQKNIKQHIEKCAGIINKLKESNEKDGGCDQVKNRIRIKLYEIQCDSKGKVTKDPVELPEKHEPEIIWGLLDKDKGRESERTIHALKDVCSIENYLCMPLNIFYLMKRNAFFSDKKNEHTVPTLKNLVSQKITRRLEDNPSEGFVQSTVNFVIQLLKLTSLKNLLGLDAIVSQEEVLSHKKLKDKKLKQKIISKIKDYEDLQSVQLASNISIQVPKFLFNIQGHKLQAEIDLLIFKNKNNARMKSRIQGALEEIPAGLLPKSLLSTLEDLMELKVKVGDELR